MKKNAFLGLALFLFLVWLVPVLSRAADGEVPLLKVADSINPGTGDYLIRAIEKAGAEKAPLLIIQIDTPGGLLSTTRSIVQAMLNSPMPIVVYVGPQGAHAGSAGALITLAADVAVMAPGTNIGAAHPVVPGSQPKEDDTMAKKMANDTAAFAESLAKAKGRNRDWAIKAVRDSSSIIAEQALKEGVIDFIASDVTDLVKKLMGHPLKVAKGEIKALPATGLMVREQNMTIKQRLVSFFADPQLAYLILSLGALCIWIELSHPGAVVPGVVGAICVILSLIAFQTLPISYGALGLLLLGFGLVIAELFVPAFGILGIGGIVCFVLGSLFLIDSDVPEMRLSLELILPTAAVLALAAVGLGTLVYRSRRLRSLSGKEALVGEIGDVRETVTADSHAGRVLVQGELWNAVSASGVAIAPPAQVVVKEVKGMLLVVASVANSDEK